MGFRTFVMCIGFHRSWQQADNGRSRLEIDRCRSFAWSRTIVTGLCLAVLPLVVGCQSQSANQAKLQSELRFEPSPPKVGPAEVVLTLKHPDGQPVAGAKIKIEGNMNHAGMKPEFADLVESDSGTYTGTLDLTMGGDWFVLVDAKLADGTTWETKIDVPGVAGK